MFFIWIILLHFELVENNREYLGDISTLQLEILKKEKEIIELKRQIEYHKNKLKYEDYLKD